MSCRVYIIIPRLFLRNFLELFFHPLQTGLQMKSTSLIQHFVYVTEDFPLNRLAFYFSLFFLLYFFFKFFYLRVICFIAFPFSCSFFPQRAVFYFFCFETSHSTFNVRITFLAHGLEDYVPFNNGIFKA